MREKKLVTEQRAKNKSKEQRVESKELSRLRDLYISRAATPFFTLYSPLSTLFLPLFYIQ